MIESAIRTGRVRGELVGERVLEEDILGVRVIVKEGEEDIPMLP